MKKAVLAAVVAAAAVAGVVVAIVASSRDGREDAAPRTTGTAATASSPGGTTAATTTAATPTSGAATGTGPTSTTGEALPPPAPKRAGPRTFVVGTVDDALAQQSLAATLLRVEASRDAAFDAAVVSATWQRGQRRPPAPLLRVLGNVARATDRARMRLVIMVWHGLGRDTPRGPAERADFAAFAGALVQAVPQVKAVIVGNEPNLSTFWSPQFGAGGSDVAARAYADLLARSYDAVKAARPEVLVLGGALSPRGADRPGGSRPTHSPTAFIRDLGAAYRSLRRSKPLMDAFAIHPYMQASRDSPTAPHPDNTTITLADYPKLVRLLDTAFRGTAQPGALPVYYTEFGVQTAVPGSKRRFYADLASAARTDAVSFDTQAAYYRRALQLALCQPTVRGLFVFHTFDEPSLNGWQSGLYFVDGSPKPSLAGFKRAVADLRSGRLHCR